METVEADESSVERIDLVDDFHGHRHNHFTVRSQRCLPPPRSHRAWIIGFHPGLAKRLVQLGYYASVRHVPIEGQC
jgi:hypothetical protein